MAEVYAPIAKDESFNTTEQTPRNLADVLAQALQALNTTISGLNFINCVVVQTLPTTDISTTTIYLVPKNPAQTDNLYDEYINLTGTSAGWEKIGDTEIDLSDYYNKTETDTLLSGKVDKVNGKGLSTEDYTTAEKTKLAGIEAGAEVNPTSGVKTATESFETVDGGLLSKCMIDLVPVQSGSGDPYPAGGGKNKLPSANSQTITQSGLTVKCDGSGLYTISAPSALASETSITLDLSEEVTLLSSGYLCVFNSAVSTAADVAIQFLSSGGTNVGAQIGFTTTPNRIVSLSGVSLASATVAKIKITVKAGVSGTYTASPMVADANNYPFAPYSNICPISGHTEVDLQVDGKNYCSEIFDSGIYTNANFTLSSPNTIQKSYKVYLKAGTYTISFNLGTTKFRILRKLIDGGYSTTNAPDITSYTFTTTIDGYVGLSFRREDNTDWDDATKVQIEKGNQATPYEPYLGHLYQVQIGSTVYGGTVDLVSGEMTATYASVDLGTLTWGYNTSRTRFESNISGIKYDADRYHLIMPNYKFFQGSPNDMPDFNYTCSNNSTGIYVKNSLYGSDTASFIASMTGYIGVYELATPQTINLTPQQIETLAGQNNLSTPLSGQSIETNGAEYKELFTFADVKEYVDTHSSTIYSEEERVIGVWIDGKRLYQKVVTGTTITGETTTAIAHGISNIDEIAFSSVLCHFSNNNAWRALNFTYNNGTSVSAWYAGYMIDPTNISFQIGASFAANIDKWRAIIQYTKTTDVAGSGT